ncbi:MAG: GlcNAc-PI de-N-acetylase [Deltaproteobacteria bacterium CG11_big_fil_rev_8_21_14_0_20_45_16]|nr:MAG: GlcNAc-PI de-N-acetylase [Deltaproteobacteria bacterium CG11_big_fil_rev_8_21_14_0_20_45_16]
MRSLFIAAHPDDEVLGAGGSIAKLTASGGEVGIILLGEGPTSRDSKDKNQSAEQAKKAAKILGAQLVAHENFPDQKFDSMDFLEITKRISKYILDYKAEAVFTHHYEDLNRDHRIISEAVVVACRAKPINKVNEVYFWENISSREWGIKARTFMPQLYIEISKTLVKKIEALEAYTTECEAFPHPRSKESLEALARVRGTECGQVAAEAFEVFRIIK